MISCVDLFCGLGGLTHGLVKGGVKVVAGIDIDEKCRFPYEHNNDARFLAVDIQKVSAESIKVLWTGATLLCSLAARLVNRSLHTAAKVVRLA